MLGFGREYNYEHFTKAMMAEDVDVKRSGGPKPGARAPDFEARSLEGESIQLRELRGKANVVLTFGSATCPMTAGSIHGMNELYAQMESDDVKFFFVYVREAHPGNAIAAHHSMDDKIRAAELLRSEEDIELPILVDDLRGTVHRKYGLLPNPTYIIDKSGRVVFRALWTQADVLKEALDQLLEDQRERGAEHTVVLGGEDTSMPFSYPVLYTYRALRRGGVESILDFEHTLGLPGKMVVASSRIMGPVAENPGRTLIAAALGAGVVAGGLLAGRALRRRRFANRNPYERYVFDDPEDEGGLNDYGAVGI